MVISISAIEGPYYNGKINENAVIWRYMDFAQYVSMLSKNALYFSSINKLKEQDHFEGIYTKKDFETLFKTVDPALVDPAIIEYFKDFNYQAWMKICDSAFANCWSIDDYESELMWKSFSNMENGIVIKSTPKKLLNSLAKNTFGIPIYEVGYIDHENEFLFGQPGFNSLSPAIYKSKYHKDEHELRALMFIFDSNDPSYGIGRYVASDLILLIESIHVSPKAEKWFIDTVKSVTLKYGIEKPVVPSDISKPPTYIHKAIAPEQLHKIS